MTEQDNQSMTVKAGSKTYFFDLKQTKEGKTYLVITESRFMGKGKEHERNSIIIFPEFAREFGNAVTEMVDKIAEVKKE